MSSTTSSEPRRFSVDARAMLTWGRDSIKDHTTAVVELVKNGYDAEATVVEVTIHADNGGEQIIRIADNGMGMTDQDVRTKWLRIGYSEKRERKKTRNGRRKTGEKGVGRISADRLGTTLELRTQAKGDEALGLLINWKQFEVSGKDLGAVEIPDLADTDFDVPRPSPYRKGTGKYDKAPKPVGNSRSCTGTELTIRNLRQRWSEEDILDLHRELSILTSPFGEVRDFQIRIVNDIVPSLNGVVTSPFFRAAEIEGEFTYSGGGDVEYKLTARDKVGARKLSDKGVIPWNQFLHRGSVANSTAKAAALGPVSIRLLFYPRVGETLRGTDLSVADLRQFLDRNAGIKVYRDDIRVMPYGDPSKPEGDWLGLGDRKARNPAGAGRADFRVSPNQLVGAVFIGRDRNPGLNDTSGREGLVHGPEFIALKALISGCLLRIEAHYHRLFEQRKAAEAEPPSPRETIEEFGTDLVSLKKQLKDVEHYLPKDAARPAALLADQLELTSKRVSKVQRTLAELASQATTYRGLATLGIAVATFGHEIEASLDQFLSSAHTSASLLQVSPPQHAIALDEIQKAIIFGKRVGAWGAYAIGRIVVDKRSRRDVPIHDLVGGILDELEPVMKASGITLTRNLNKVVAKTFPMDVESVLINLLTNAYYFAKQKSGRREIAVSLRRRKHETHNGFEITVSDTGPGIASDLQEQIWEPLFSTKLDRNGQAEGTGLGLSIIDAVLKDAVGTRLVDKDPVLGGARFTVWLKAD